MSGLKTSDIGVAIRDFLEDQEIQDDILSDQPADHLTHIDFVDVSGASNPVIHTEAGVFRVSIVRVGP